MAKQKIKREEIATCPICQEQIEFKVDLQIEAPDNVAVLGASLQIPLVHKECAQNERERTLSEAQKPKQNKRRGQNKYL